MDNRTAAALLAIPDDCPERLFAGSAADIRNDYRRLATQWHPDRNRDADAHAVFQHIRRLYEAAEQRMAGGARACRGPLTLTAIDGRRYEIDCLRRHPFEPGTVYVAHTVIAFVVDDAHADLVRRAGRAIAWAAPDLMDTGRADIRTDLELVRALGRELLGDVTGARLSRDSAAPRAMVDWLRLPASADPIEEYRTWRTQVLPDSFGARRFVELPLTQSDIYR